ATLAATYLYLTFADVLPGAYVGEPDTAAVFHELLVGHLAVYFWVFVIAAGVLPLLLIALPWTRNVWGVVIASVLVVPVLWVKRMLMVVDPSTYNSITGTFGSYHFTWVSIAITLAGLAAIPLLLMLLFRVVPLLSIDEMEEASTGYEHMEPGGRGGDDARVIGATSKSHRVAGVAGVLLFVAVLGVIDVGTANTASAATPPTQAEVTITGAEEDGLVLLTATLTGPDRNPIPNANVAFLIATTEFGTPARFVQIGSDNTDATGVAKLILGGGADHQYRPTATGPQEFFASYAAAADAEPIMASTIVDVTVAVSPYRPAAPKPLASVGKGMVGVLLAIVVAVWLTLAAQVWRVRRVCRAPRSRQRPDRVGGAERALVGQVAPAARD
ncbi:MAG TPA: hypothetical protein VFY84_05330, partial [Jiangellales bacterium]|nr:hypothetical protein [Jiangellales bacterium]